MLITALLIFVILAKAGTQFFSIGLGSRLRGNDEEKGGRDEGGRRSDA